MIEKRNIRFPVKPGDHPEGKGRSNDGGSAFSPARQHTQQEKSQDGAPDEGVHFIERIRQRAQAADQQRAYRANRAPADGSPSSDAHVVTFSFIRSEPSLVEIHGGGRGECIDAGAHDSHGGGKDGGNDQSGKDPTHLSHHEKWHQGIVIGQTVKTPRKRMVERVKYSS